MSRRSVTPRDLSNTGSPAGFPKTRAKKRGGMWRIKSAMLSLCLCECGPHSPIATTYTLSSLQSLLGMTRSSQAVTKTICAVQLGCLKANDPPLLYLVLHLLQEIPIIWYRLSHSLRWWPEVISRLPFSSLPAGWNAVLANTSTYFWGTSYERHTQRIFHLFVM